MVSTKTINWLQDLLEISPFKNCRETSFALFQCHTISQQAIRRLRNEQIGCTYLVCKGNKFDITTGYYDNICSWHVMIKVGNDCVDFTWRQFVGDGPFPLVCDLKELGNYWEEIIETEYPMFH